MLPFLPFATMWMETVGYYAKRNKSVREIQISYDFTHMWNLRNLTDDHRGRDGKMRLKTKKESNHKKLLNTENKLKVGGHG